jgi:two-component system LytT family response regulator
MIRALIIDDEPLARRRIRRMLAGERDIAVIAECSSGLEALPVIEEQSPDLLFLDVQMPGMDGLELLNNLKRRRMPAVIFTTAFDQYAVRAFDLHALDYVLKPIDEQRFHEALERARTHMRHKNQTGVDQRLAALLEDLQKQSTSLDRLVIKQPGRAFFVKAKSIDWLEAADNYVRLHVGTETHLIRETLGSLEARLDPKTFVRIHRSTIVNIDRIKEIQSFFQGNQVVVLINGQKLKLSRSYREKLETVLGQIS